MNRKKPDSRAVLFSRNVFSPGLAICNKQKYSMNNQAFFTKILHVLFWGAVLFLWGFNSARAQDTLQVRGKVLNENSQPVSNVAVGVEGSFELPAVTNAAGEFTINVLLGNEWLNISPSSGYKEKRVFLNDRTEITIYLTSSDISAGDDPIAVLNQTRLKRNMISTFSVLNTDQIKQTPALTVEQFMQGRVSGLYVINRTGDPAGGAATFLRGVNSLNASNEPFYVVDGIPVSSMGVFNSILDGFSYNSLLSLNNLDISKVTVIKDPLLLAAYGSKASNGLVIIETLDPSATQTVIDLDLRSGYSLAPSNQIPQLSAGQHKTLASEVLFSSGKQEEWIREEYPNLFLTPRSERWKDYQHNTKWQDIIFNNAFFSNLNVNVKGGDEIARYGLSFGYMNADGIIRNTGYDGYNLRFVSRLNIFQWLKMNAGVSMSYNLSQLKESGKLSATNPILTSLGKSPMLNPFRYDEEGRELNTLAPVDELGVSNPQAVIDNYEAKNSNFHFISTLGFEADLKENLVINTNFGLTYNVLKELIFMPNQGMELYYNREAINVSKGSNNSLSSFYNNTYLKFEKQIGNDHHITSNTGVNLMTNDYEYDWGLTKNAHENDQYRMLQDGTNSLREIGGANRNWTWLSFYENATYSYKDRYLASVTLSLDGSSRVGDNAANTIKIGGVPFGLFYAGGLAWRLSGEPFMNHLAWLEEMKFRVSYGRTGNDDIGEANATNYYNAVKFRETVGLFPALIPNDELTYETVEQLNGGFDLALWGNRVAASIDVYQSTTENMLIYNPLKAYFGYDFRPENGGKMQNNGIDLSLFFRIVDRPSFKWDVQASVSTVKNQVLEMKGGKLVTEMEGLEIVNMPGEQANSFYGFVFEGVYASNQEALDAGLVNERLIAYQGGDAKFADLSGPNGTPDGIINDYDKTVLGASLPEQFGGISNTFTYKRWGLNTFLQFVKGNEVYNYIRYKNESMSGLENQSTNVLNRWQYDGQETGVPRALWQDPIGNSSFSSRWIEDGSYFRLKNISLTYTIPNEFLAFRNAQFYLSASNVLTVSKYLGYDPEFAYSFAQMEQGIDYGLTPQPRQFIVGVKLGL
ncbi:TonB-linked outer membrane protein, SusC/RagA family [Mariniphaga anaerophila]|uniref:TonB-linked outer membrane protein, SusC/RagA family n=1 Tax=Mariniphaga anaerophila TaxID=1484053 RepID=A0A1M4W3G8_9BACT|nr:SusC/RagA family TonB-linked outer membrane protein [Mariniphaga anaerophila]SHE75705.1 TonB-linked outer membrane protein, SusC/RagA family [Mariniphaga anaerophila]